MSKVWWCLLAIFLLLLIVFFVIRPGHLNNQPSTSSVNLYQQQANKICQMLDRARVLYQNNHAKEAYDLAENSYWNVYDNILEIKYRSYATPAYIFAVENAFHQVSTLMTQPLTPANTKEITKRNKALCAEVNKEAHYLIQSG